MPKYICMLRAINVSGQRKITMLNLKKLICSLSFENVETYLQTGNVILSSDLPALELNQQLSSAIKTEFGYDDIDIFIWTLHDLSLLVQNNPFCAIEDDFKKLHVTFLTSVPDNASYDAIDKSRFEPDIFALNQNKNALYIHCPNGYGRTKINNGFFEKKLNLRATTRNWNTVNKLLEMAGN